MFCIHLSIYRIPPTLVFLHFSFLCFNSFRYLHLVDNNIDKAIAEARADIQWEKSQREQQHQAEAHDLNLLVVDTQKMKDGDQIAVAIPVDRENEDKVGT